MTSPFCRKIGRGMSLQPGASVPIGYATGILVCWRCLPQFFLKNRISFSIPGTLTLSGCSWCTNDPSHSMPASYKILRICSNPIRSNVRIVQSHLLWNFALAHSGLNTEGRRLWREGQVECLRCEDGLVARNRHTRPQATRSIQTADLARA